MAARQTYKCTFVGEGGVGKSSFIAKLRTNTFEKKYIATLGVATYPIEVEKDKVCFNMWDTAGQEKLGGLRDGYYIKSDCGVVMTDYNREGKINLHNLAKWHKDLRRVCPQAPIVVVVNKWDILKVVNDEKIAQGEMIHTLAPTIKLNGEKLRLFYISTRDDTKEQLFAPLEYLLGELKKA